MTFSHNSLFRLAAKLSRCLSLALLPALASEAHALSHAPRKNPVRSASATASSSKSNGTPYLAALAPLPLRFARPGLEPAAEPPAPPVAKTPEPAAIEPQEPQKPAGPPADIPTSPAIEQPVAQLPHEEPDPVVPPPLPILPDDTKRELRAEDVLLYFRFPGENGPRGAVAVPVSPTQPQSAPLPPSSATYEQK